ncbi:hypothetical protein ACFSKK_08700 [Metabacillus endolithicus]|uniref:Sigma-70 family RNA polymerase sigma factor n=1 Tax=Metabacillus endolithicus TaxID=1535204 RepID=A0ABW5BXY1_9BACI
MSAHVLQVEKLWEQYALTRSEVAQDKLLRHLAGILRKKAESWGHRWNNCKLCAADFESIFLEEAWKLCEKYNHYDDFYFYETLLLVCNRRAIDLIRTNTKTKQGAFNIQVLRLKEEAADFLADTSVNVEEDVIFNSIVTQIFKDTSLTEQERLLLLARYEYPDASLKELSNLVGLEHHEQVRRSFNRIRKKMAHYI